MRYRSLPLCFSLSFLAFTLPAPAQTSAQVAPQRDPTALALIGQAVNAAGGATAIGSVGDYTATGTITLNWPGDPVTASVTVRGRGARQLRIDIVLPQGTRSSGYDDGAVWQENADGTVQRHPFQHVEEPGYALIPAAELAEALANSSISVTDLGLVTVNGRQEHGVRLAKTFTPQQDRTGARAKMSVRDFFIDPATYLVLRTRDIIYEHGLLNRPVVHETLYSNYVAFGGVALPGTVTQTIFHQQTFSMKLTQLTLNGGLAESDFQP